MEAYNKLKNVEKGAEKSDRLSREVRTTLNRIVGLAQELLKSENLAPRCQNDVELIVESGNSLLALFDNIMDESRIEAEDAKINDKQFCLNAKISQKDRDWSGYTALVVDDNILNYKIICGMLRNTGINILHAGNGLKAVEQVRSNPQIDLVLMDLYLPVMNGLEATDKILDIDPSLPVIAQTCGAMSENRELCIDVGCIDFIGKPINMEELLTKMSRYLPEKIYSSRCV